MQKNYYVYIMASKPNGTLYIGITNNLSKRVYQHKLGSQEGFTKQYKVYKLVYYEETTLIVEAISREKQLKNWHRQWKINLIESMNPEWRDLADDL